MSAANPYYLYLLKRCWLIALCAVIGYAGGYWYANQKSVETYTASGTMYVYNSNPNMVNYQYASSSDLNTAVQLLDTYIVVVKSNKVMDVVVERLIPDYPNITGDYIRGTLSMGSVSETGVLRVSCRTVDPQRSADICNAVLDVAPSEIIRVVGAGKAEPLDYAVAPRYPDGFSARRMAMIGALGGAAAAVALLAVLFLLNRKVSDTKELSDNYKPPVLASVKRDKRDSEDAGSFMLTDKSPMDITESYAKLRMNLLFTLVGKDSCAVEVTSAIAGEGKSTITANLAISCAMSGKKVLLIDADMRRACQKEIFHYSRKHQGLSNVLVGECEWQSAVMDGPQENLSILSAGHIPPNPAELLGSEKMRVLLEELQKHYDVILLDAPPVNIVSDPLALSDRVAGCLFVVRQNFSDHREIRKALTAAELTGMNVLGFAFYGEKVHQGSYYYSRKYYHNYYHKYDTRRRDASENKNSNK